MKSIAMCWTSEYLQEAWNVIGRENILNWEDLLLEYFKFLFLSKNK